MIKINDKVRFKRSNGIVLFFRFCPFVHSFIVKNHFVPFSSHEIEQNGYLAFKIDRLVRSLPLIGILAKNALMVVLQRVFNKF
ncbi:hypothetical protein BpHYR1_026627 [Brachionus plicatilis]|uniref:Uncharacterized protein n=1 Tax=Brachionus plicatilis TaxID=10195 RepID=A0A3M7RD27_BRAPC|nr:hypothetical protein BpHYR1_026627 [Brachionus plicatilis]